MRRWLWADKFCKQSILSFPQSSNMAFVYGAVAVQETINLPRLPPYDEQQNGHNWTVLFEQSQKLRQLHHLVILPANKHMFCLLCQYTHLAVNGPSRAPGSPARMHVRCACGLPSASIRQDSARPSCADAFRVRPSVDLVRAGQPHYHVASTNSDS